MNHSMEASPQSPTPSPDLAVVRNDYWETATQNPRSGLPGEHLLRFESRQWAGDLLTLGKDAVRRIRPNTELEAFVDAHRENYKRQIDAEFIADGFSIEAPTMRLEDGTSYQNTLLYRRGDRYPERALVISHGFTAGYESHAALIGSELRDFTLVIHNRPGVDALNADTVNRNHDDERRFRDAMQAQRQAAELALGRDAGEVVLAGHSMSGQITVSNLFEQSEWDRKLREAVLGSVLLNSPSERDATKNSVIGKIMRPSYRLLRAAAIHPDLQESAAPRVITHELADSIIIDRMIGEVDDLRGLEVYGASKHRASVTPWRSLVFDLGALQHAPERHDEGQLLGLHHLVIEGRHDRLVLPPAGRRLIRMLSTAKVDGHRNVVHKQYADAGHFSHASHPERVNRDIYEFMVNLPERARGAVARSR